MRPVVVLCVLALVLSACGAAPRDSAKDFSGAKRDVATTVEDVEDAAAKDDVDRLCTKLLSDDLLAALKKQGTNCATAVKQAFKNADSTDLTVDDVSVSAGTATAKVTSGTGSRKATYTLEFEKVGASWKISSMRA
jgi:hypothetical protein